MSQPATAHRPAPSDVPPISAEVEARLASIRLALATAEEFGGGPASDANSAPGVAAAWLAAPRSRRRWFDRHTGRVMAATSDGLDALMAEQARGHRPSQAAAEQLASEIRRGLAEASLHLGA